MPSVFSWQNSASLSHFIAFLYFFALITEEAFLISPCYSLELCIQMGISFLFSFAFCFSSFLSYSRGKTPLAFDLLHLVLQGQICLLLQVSLHFLLCIPISYDEKDIYFGYQFQKILQVFIELFSFFSITGWAQTWNTVILNGLPWK